MNFNKVIIGGNITRDPELKKTKTDKSCCQLSVAYNKVYNNEKTTMYFNVTVWGKVAENCCKYLTKGSSVLVEGELSTRSYEKDGTKKTITEVVASHVEFCGKPSQKKTQEEQYEPVDDGYVPF